MEFISTLQSGLDEQNPSLFEILSEQQLAALIPPSIRYLLVLATQRYPRYLLHVLNSFDELHALAMVAVERHYLRTYGGGFTENFYGLKRERLLHVKGGSLPRTQLVAPEQLRDSLKLSEGDVWKNIAVMVGIPYLRRKLDEAYEIYTPQALLLGSTYNRNTLPPDASVGQRILYHYKWFLRNIYPSVNAAYYFSILVFNLAYLFSNTAFSSPFLWLIRTRIRRMNGADYRAIAAAANQPRSTPRPAGRPGQSNSIFHPRNITNVVIPGALSGLKILLPTSIFLLKFLEWWHASDFGRQLVRKAAEGLELPPPIVAGMPPPSPKTDGVIRNKQTNSVSLGHPPGTKPSPSTITPIAQTKQPKPRPPISSFSHLPILTVPAPSATTSALCPICLNDIITPTAAQTGYVFCYTCIFKWVEGTHDRQIAWMEGGGGGEGWGEDTGSEAGDDSQNTAKDKSAAKPTSRVGTWESGKGRCAVTGRRLLGGVEGLRRIIA